MTDGRIVINMVGDMMVLIHKHEDGTILRLNKVAQESYTWTPVDF